EREPAPRRRFPGRQGALAAEAAGTDGPPQVTGGGAAHERPRERREPVLEAAERLVVAAPLLGVGECLVGGLQVPERLAHRLRAGHVGMKLLGQAAIGALDRRGGRVAADAEDAVVVLGLFHPRYTIGRGRNTCQAEFPAARSYAATILTAPTPR